MPVEKVSPRVHNSIEPAELHLDHLRFNDRVIYLATITAETKEPRAERLIERDNPVVYSKVRARKVRPIESPRLVAFE